MYLLVLLCSSFSPSLTTELVLGLLQTFEELQYGHWSITVGNSKHMFTSLWHRAKEGNYLNDQFCCFSVNNHSVAQGPAE